MTEARLHYLKNVLGIHSVLGDFSLNAQSTLEPECDELSYQIQNHGNILFLAASLKNRQRQFLVEELQLLEKIIVALKLQFSKVDMAYWNTSIQSFCKQNLKKHLQAKSYDYVFYFGSEGTKLFGLHEDALNKEFVDGKERFFITLHPQEMLQKPESKKEIWNGFQKIIPHLPR